MTFIGDLKNFFTTEKQVIFGKDIVEGIGSISVKSTR